jgi:hypothetical protein
MLIAPFTKVSADKFGSVIGAQLRGLAMTRD